MKTKFGVRHYLTTPYAKSKCLRYLRAKQTFVISIARKWQLVTKNHASFVHKFLLGQTLEMIASQEIF